MKWRDRLVKTLLEKEHKKVLARLDLVERAWAQCHSHASMLGSLYPYCMNAHIRVLAHNGIGTLAVVLGDRHLTSF